VSPTDRAFLDQLLLQQVQVGAHPTRRWREERKVHLRLLDGEDLLAEMHLARSGLWLWGLSKEVALVTGNAPTLAAAVAAVDAAFASVPIHRGELRAWMVRELRERAGWPVEAGGYRDRDGTPDEDALARAAAEYFDLLDVGDVPDDLHRLAREAAQRCAP